MPIEKKPSFEDRVGFQVGTTQEKKAVESVLNKYDPSKCKSKMVIPPKTWADHYCEVMCFFLGPFAVLVWIFFTFASFPLLALWTGYMHLCVKTPTDRDESIAFSVMGYVTYPYAALLYAFSAFWWWFVFFSIMFMSLPACLFRVVFLCQGKKIAKNFRLLWPWMKYNRFSYFMLVRAVLGEIHRQGLCKFVFGKGIIGGWAANVAYIPIIKYAWSANPLLYILDEVFINQWTPPIKNLPEEEVIDTVRVFVSRFKEKRLEQKVIDHVRFAAHYPYGPSLAKEADSVIGLQFPMESKMINMTNTIHVPRDYKNQFSMPGYVEVNFRLDKGLEHPMWMVVPPLNYWGMQSYSWVNDLFAAFVPDVVEFVEDFEADAFDKPATNT